MLHISLPFSLFFNVFLNKSNYFRNVELHAFQLIVIFFHLNVLTDLMLCYFHLLYYQIGQNIFLYILSSFARSKVKTLIVKFRLLARKTSISGISLTFFY